MVLYNTKQPLIYDVSSVLVISHEAAINSSYLMSWVSEARMASGCTLCMFCVGFQVLLTGTGYSYIPSIVIRNYVQILDG